MDNPHAEIETSRKCPICHEEIPVQASQCKHCGAGVLVDFGESIERQWPICGKAIMSFLFSLLGFLICGLGNIIGIALGYQARQEIYYSDGYLYGDRLAKAGIILGWIGVVLAILFAIIAMNVPPEFWR